VDDTYHIPVLLHEAVELLVTARAGIYVDGTLGGGGHAEAICDRIFPEGTLIGIDADEDAQREAQQRLARFAPRVIYVHDNTAYLRSILHSRDIHGIHGLLLDLGVSSFQLDEHGKGFTFRADAPLDMRMDIRQGRDARAIVNEYDEYSLTNIFFKYGEDNLSRRIARAIVAHRTDAPIETTGQLAAIVERCVGGKFATKSLARIFQALRIEVNDELGRLETMLKDGVEMLVPGGRIVVIAYHSLEDRIVKNYFADKAATTTPSGVKFLPDTPRDPELRLLMKKPLIASEEELQTNPRARSAKLRAAEKV
jgi:16S rRNA (cytosine1402-N4)-methyltransferase